MRRRSSRAHTRVAGLLAALVALFATAAACPGVAGAGEGTQAGGGPGTANETGAEAARVARYWPPARMRSARPLDLVVGDGGKARLVASAPPTGALASFVAVPTPEAPPYSANGRIFIRRGKLAGYCSGTAINSPTRQLVLTAGHCVNTGRENGKASVWSNYLEFVPASNGGGGRLIGDGTQIDGINPYLHLNNKSHTFGPYFAAETVGKLVAGL